MLTVSKGAEQSRLTGFLAVHSAYAHLVKTTLAAITNVLLKMFYATIFFLELLLLG